MPLNMRRGLHRVFILACAGWALFMLLIFPMMEASRARRFAEDAQAYDIAHPSDSAAARVEREKEIRGLYSQATVEYIYRHHVLPNWPLALGALLLPPLVVYALARLGIAVGGWLARGFRA